MVRRCQSALRVVSNVRIVCQTAITIRSFKPLLNLNMSKVYKKMSVVGHTQEYIGLTQPRKEEQDVGEEKERVQSTYAKCSSYDILSGSGEYNIFNSVLRGR
jgi:hypothetical protein